jgi:MFS family permease
LLLFASVGPHTAYFPTILFANFLIGLGIGNAFMPLLTLAMEGVPAPDAGLASGITNVSQQIGGALGLAVLSTIAANHTRTLVSSGQGVTTSLISGYTLAFVVAAGATLVAILLAFALLRPRSTRPELQLAADEPTPAPANVELEPQAA